MRFWPLVSTNAVFRRASFATLSLSCRVLLKDIHVKVLLLCVCAAQSFHKIEHIETLFCLRVLRGVMLGSVDKLIHVHNIILMKKDINPEENWIKRSTAASGFVQVFTLVPMCGCFLERRDAFNSVQVHPLQSIPQKLQHFHK